MIILDLPLVRCAWRAVRRGPEGRDFWIWTIGAESGWAMPDRSDDNIIWVSSSNNVEHIDMRTGIIGLYLSNTTQVYPEDRGQNYSLLLGEKVAELIDRDFGRTGVPS